MSPIKEAVGEILRTLPDDATIEDVMYRLYVRSQIERGLKAIEDGNVHSEEEADAIIDQWLQE